MSANLSPLRSLLVAGVLLCTAADARADYLFTPFMGTTFSGSSTLLDLDVGATGARHWTFGGAAAWLSDRVLGFEADVAAVPGFFQTSGGTGLVVSSRVTTVTGNVLAAFPLSVTRESLRPYVTGGFGMMRATAEDIIGLNESGTWTGMQLGAGAIGLISNRAGIRFDLRHSRTLGRETNLRGDLVPRLSFWRATVGLTIRY